MRRPLPPRPEISLADLVRAVGVLDPRDAATRRAIARALGFEVREAAAPAGPTEGSRPPRRPARQPRGERPSSSTPPVAEESPADLPPEIQTAAPRPGVLEPLAPRRDRRRPPVEGLDLDELLAPEPGAETAPLPDLSLLLPRWRRGLLTATLAAPSPEGELDVDRLVDELSRGEVPREIPRRPVPTLRRGVQLLLDEATGMQPFVADQERLTGWVRETVGEDLVQVLRFWENPLEGAGDGGLVDWEEYEPPARGRPVLASTDLGLSGVSEAGVDGLAAAWRRLADLLGARGSRLVVLVPFPPGRWPARLSAHLTLLEWDRGTGLHEVRQALARSGQVRQVAG